ncbi:MAG: sugar phosphate isomerase/epimerase family protein [Nocardioides sp.]
MNTTPELLASCWTSAGNARPLREDERSPESIGDRIDAVADAGFTSMGLTHADVVSLKQTVGLPSVAEHAAERGVRIAELEMVMDWYEVEDRDLRRAADQVRDDLLGAAAELEVGHIKAGCDYLDREWDLDHLALEFGRLCSVADQTGVRVALEPQAFCHIKTPEHALRLIEQSEAATAGLCIDIWHLERIGYPHERLAGIDPARIICVEINDAAAEPRGTLIEDTIANRLLPGTGAFDLPGFIGSVRAAGYSGPWGVELLSDDFRRTPLRTALRDAYATTASVFAALE